MFCLYNMFSFLGWAVAHFLFYRMFGTYAMKMRIHHMCLKEFKESPTSKRVIDNLPPMDIIKENDFEEEEDEKSSDEDDLDFSHKLNETEEILDTDASTSRKAEKLSRIRKIRVKQAQK